MSVSTSSRKSGVGSAVWMSANWSGVMMRRCAGGTVGALMPAHGCRSLAVAPDPLAY
jgi:hypothetical protein